MADDKWKYLTMRMKYQELPQNMNRPRREGWEAFAVVETSDTECMVFFKRRESN